MSYAQPNEAIKYYSQVFPKIWHITEKLLEIKIKLNNTKQFITPDWCFLPMNAYINMLDIFQKNDIVDKNLTRSERSTIYVGLSAIIPWYYTRYVYKIDDDFFKELTKTEFKNKVPVSILLKLPVYGIFIDLHGKSKNYKYISGVFVSLMKVRPEDNVNAEVSLNYQVLGVNGQMLPVAIPLNENMGIRESIKVVLKNREDELLDPNVKQASEQDINLLSDIINILLYICSEEPDLKQPKWYGERKGNPTPVKHKGKFKLLSPKHNKNWHVGLNVGKKIREYNSYTKKMAAQGKKRPHIRRAHWHGYWIGPKDAPTDLRIKWVSQTLVATRNDYQEKCHE